MITAENVTVAANFLAEYNAGAFQKKKLVEALQCQAALNQLLYDYYTMPVSHKLSITILEQDLKKLVKVVQVLMAYLTADAKKALVNHLSQRNITTKNAEL